MLYTIPTENMESVLGKVIQLNKKAKKLNAPEVKMSVVNEYDKFINNVAIPFTDIEITGTVPKIDGWEFIARLEFSQENGKNTIFKFKQDETIPTEYLTSNACEHCNTKHKRVKTYILKKDDKFFQVGSSCLKDFFCVDIESIMLSFQSLFDVLDELDNLDEFYGKESFSKGKTMISMKSYLEYVVMTIRLDGGKYRKDWEY